MEMRSHVSCPAFMLSLCCGDLSPLTQQSAVLCSTGIHQLPVGESEAAPGLRRQREVQTWKDAMPGSAGGAWRSAAAVVEIKDVSTEPASGEHGR